MIGPGLFLMLLVIASTVTIYYMIKSRHDETMAKIEHGILDGDIVTKSKVMLNLGVFFCFIGGGITLAYIISKYSSIPDHVAFPATLFIAGGVGLIVSYLINNRADRG